MVDRKDGRPPGFQEDATPFGGGEALRGEAERQTVTATDAKNRFGELLEMARKAPVAVQKNGRTVAMVISHEEYQRLSDASAAPKARPLVERLLEKSIQRRRSLYEALAR